MSAIPKIWIFTDGHWHQDGPKIDRPPEHTELQFANIKRTVGPDDLVIHCGDVTWSAKLLKEDMDKLPGRWVLVRGNHDSESLPWYMRNGFIFACDSFVFRKVLFTHAPANELPGNALLNVHGHLHGNQHRVLEHSETCLAAHVIGEAVCTPDCNAQKPWRRLLAIENTRYTPVKFDKFVGNLGVVDLV